MAPATKDNSASAGGDDKLNFLKQAFKCTNGVIDFDKFAGMIGSPNGEAARKKFKRVFEKDEVPLNIVGSTLNAGTDGVIPAKITRTPKAKASNGDDPSTPKTKASAKKRKAADATEDTDEDDLIEEETAPSKKKAKTTTNGSTKTPKSPRTPKTPRAPRTPNSALSSAKVEESEDSSTDLKDDDGVEARSGSPEVQAKTDAIVKYNEKALDSEIGVVEKQAIHDGVAKEMATGKE